MFPKLFCTFVSESPAVFGVNGCGFRRGSVDPQPFSTFVSQMAVASSKVLWRVSAANCALYSSPSLLGARLPELLTCLNHTNAVHRYDPSCRCCWGILLREIQRQKSPQKDVVNQRMGPKIPRRTTSPPCAARCGGIT